MATTKQKAPAQPVNPDAKAAEEEPNKVEKKKAPPPPLKQASFKLAEAVRQVWAVAVEVGVEVEDLLGSNFWSHVSRNFRPGDRIEARAVDGAYFAELMVLQAGSNWARVVLLAAYKLDPEASKDVVEIEDFVVEWAGPVDLWRVRRKSDNAVIQRNIQSKSSAINVAVEHRKLVA